MGSRRTPGRQRAPTPRPRAERPWKVKVDRAVREKLAAEFDADHRAEIEAWMQTLPQAVGFRLSGPEPLFRARGAEVIARFIRDDEARVIRVRSVAPDIDVRAEHRKAVLRRIKPVTIWGAATTLGLAAVLILLSNLFPRPPAPIGTELVTVTSRSHVSGHVLYERLPPAGGDHAPIWAKCGVYDKSITTEEAVHSLEHGAVWITYQDTLSANDIAHLRDLATSEYVQSERYVIVSPFPGQKSAVVVTAWGAQLNHLSVGDPRIRQFIDHFKAGDQAVEPSAACYHLGDGTPVA